jgi:hypothetical protein
MNATHAALAAAALLAAHAFAAPPAGYAVHAELMHEGRVFASPSLVLRDGEPASVAVSGDDGYRLELEVTQTTAGQLSVVAKVESPHGAIAPTMTIRPGEPARVSIDDLGLVLTVMPAD